MIIGTCVCFWREFKLKLWERFLRWQRLNYSLISSMCSNFHLFVYLFFVLTDIIWPFLSDLYLFCVCVCLCETSSSGNLFFFFFFLDLRKNKSRLRRNFPPSVNCVARSSSVLAELYTANAFAFGCDLHLLANSASCSTASIVKGRAPGLCSWPCVLFFPGKHLFWSQLRGIVVHVRHRTAGLRPAPDIHAGKWVIKNSEVLWRAELVEPALLCWQRLCLRKWSIVKERVRKAAF